ncbi:MAG: mechanosensitive ion channel family protein [Pseudomonadota bacterium]|nr:mechanosensitive ion channel family protein [Pseudomonadota bacterium]
MEDIIQLVGPNQAVELFGIRLVGINAENGTKLLLTLACIVMIVILGRLLRGVAALMLRGQHRERAAFWTRQGIRLVTALLLLLGIISIWFDDPTRLATGLGLVTAGLAFALQKVVTAVAGYFIILRGKTFNVGDRIRMGGVRGDVIALSFTQTTIMEMGQPPSVQGDEPAMWVQSRQYTGRVVTVSNAVIFDEPVYNYSRDFPYLWEEMILPIPYAADRHRAERILLEVAQHHTRRLGNLGDEALQEMQRRYFMTSAGVQPKVYYRLTDNWLELTVRFIAEAHGIRELKDAMSRDILRALDEAGIGLASATFEIVGLPPLRIADAPAGPGQ